MKRSFTRKIILSYALFTGVIVIFFLIYFNSIIREAHTSIIKREISEKLNLVDFFIKEYGTFRTGDNRHISSILRKGSEIIDLRITIIDFNGKVITDSDIINSAAMENHLYRPEVQQAITTGTGFSVRRSSTLGSDEMYGAKKSDGFVIRLAKPLHEIDASVTATRRGVLIAGFVLMMGSFLIIIFISGRISKPIRETGEFATQFAEGNLDIRIMNYSNDEIGSVQRTLNMMAETISDKIEGVTAEREKLRTAIETIPDGIALIAHDKRIALVNESFIKIFSSARNHEGKLFFEVIRSKNINLKIEEIISSGKPQHFEEEAANGRVYDAFLNTVNESRETRSVLLVLHDITDMKRIERIKSDLVGNMSHELKTPIAIMKGYLETIKETLHNPESCQPMIAKAIENADRQNSIINDILKLHSMERSDSIQNEEIAISDIINNCINIIQPKAAAREIKFIQNISQIPALVKGNRFLAEEIFFNLIDNAVNYNNQSGEVIINSEMTKSSFIINVDDTGTGIPADSIDRIFERFYRVDKSRSRSTGGTGLGLSIVKHAAELLGWKVHVSNLSQGARFSVEVPVK